MNRQDIVNKFEVLLKDEVELELENLTETTDLSLWGVDSLSIMNIVSLLEKKFNIELDPDEIGGFFVNDFVHAISSKLT